MSRFRFTGVQGDEALLPVHLVPLPRQQLAQPNAGEVGGHEKRLEIVWQSIPQLGVLIVGQESLPRVFFSDHREVEKRGHFGRCAFASKIERSAQD